MLFLHSLPIFIIAGIICQIGAIPHLFGSEDSDAESVDSEVIDERGGDWKAAFKYSPYFPNIWGSIVDVEEDSPAKAERVIILGGPLEPRGIIANPKAITNPKNHPGPSIASLVSSSTINTAIVPTAVTSANSESRGPAPAKSSNQVITHSSMPTTTFPERSLSDPSFSTKSSASTRKTSTTSAAHATPTIGHTVSGLKLDGIHTGIGTCKLPFRPPDKKNAE